MSPGGTPWGTPGLSGLGCPLFVSVCCVCVVVPVCLLGRGFKRLLFDDDLSNHSSVFGITVCTVLIWGFRIVNVDFGLKSNDR